MRWRAYRGGVDRPADTEPAAAGTTRSVAVAVLLYVGARLLLVALIAGVLVALGMPVLVALLVGIVASLPLSVLLFRGLRARLARETEAATATRRTQRERLRAELRGDTEPDPRDRG